MLSIFPQQRVDFPRRFLERGLRLHLAAHKPASFARMEAYCAEHGYVRTSKAHREIYLSDPRKTEPSKLKTVLRFQVRKRQTEETG